MALKYFLSGFFVKIIAGFDDTMTRIPILAIITRTKLGKFAFVIGAFLAIILAIILSFLFGSVIKTIPYSNYISAGLIFLIAMSIYFDWFVQKPKKRVERSLVHLKPISKKRFIKLIIVGFFTAFATIIDDIFVYSGLFLGKLVNAPFVITGILSATILQLGAVFYFSHKLMKMKYKKEITVIGLIILAGLIAFKIL